MVKLKRIYEKPEKSDGFRILVDRLWPRGVSKEKAALDLWLKDIAPSGPLRKWFGHNPKRWAAFQKKYRSEVATNKEVVGQLRGIIKKRKNVTLLYAAKDKKYNEAVVIRNLYRLGYFQMENKYLNEMATLLKQVHPKLSTTHRLEFKNVFGAVGGYVNGRIFISCGKFGTALRLPPETLEKLFKEKNVKRLKYFPNGHNKKEYAVLSQTILENRRKLKKLVDESIKFVLK